MARIFIAFDVSDEARDYLFNLQKELSKFVKAKWVEKKNIHLTLKFLGEIDDEKLEKLKKELSKIKFKRFDVVLDELGVFPDENFTRVIWVGLKGEGIFNLQKKIDEELLELFSQDQKFTSHITLGRVKAVKDKEKLKEFFSKIKIDEIKFTVDNFKLYRSELSKDGPKYYLLDEYGLI